MPVTLSAGRARLVFDPAGGRITSLCIDGVELLLPVVDDLVGGAYPMAPYAGRARRGQLHFDGRTYALPITLPPHAIHGSVRHLLWTGGGDTWEAPLSPGWPFAGACRQRLDLAPDRLALELRVEAHARMPVSLGWHPWFRRGLLQVRPRAMFVRDTDGIPTGETVPPPPGPWDDAFVLDGPPELTVNGLRVRLESDAPVWVVYDQRPDTFCVEPQTAPPDAANLGRAAVLEPGEHLRLEVTVRWG